MCVGGTKTVQAPAPIPQELAAPPEAPKQADEAVRTAAKAEKAKAEKNRGRGSTILTGARGLVDEAETGQNRILGTA